MNESLKLPKRRERETEQTNSFHFSQQMNTSKVNIARLRSLNLFNSYPPSTNAYDLQNELIFARLCLFLLASLIIHWPASANRSRPNISPSSAWFRTFIRCVLVILLNRCGLQIQRRIKNWRVGCLGRLHRLCFEYSLPFVVSPLSKWKTVWWHSNLANWSPIKCLAELNSMNASMKSSIPSLDRWSALLLGRPTCSWKRHGPTLLWLCKDRISIHSSVVHGRWKLLIIWTRP